MFTMTTSKNTLSTKNSTLRFFILSFFLISLVACKKQLDTERVFYDNFEVQEMLLEERLPTDTQPDTELFNQAIAQYKSKDYSTAGASFAKLAQDEPRSGAYPYFAASAYMAAGLYKEALPYYQKVIEHPRSPKTAQIARWNSALAMIKLKDLAGAQEKLQAIKEGEFRYNKATDLLKAF